MAFAVLEFQFLLALIALFDVANGMIPNRTVVDWGPIKVSEKWTKMYWKYIFWLKYQITSKVRAFFFWQIFTSVFKELV